MEDRQKDRYLLMVLSSLERSIYSDLLRFSSHVHPSVYEMTDEGKTLLFFSGFDEKTEEAVRIIKILPIIKEIFEHSSYELTLKKEHFKNLTNLYKLLDHKFAYFEMRIREIEVAPEKDDVAWILLSKYHIILDTKMYLYDLQQDLFKEIDAKRIVRYGLIYRRFYPFMYQKEKILPSFDLYEGPIGMLLARYYLSFSDQLDSKKFQKEIDQIDPFNQKYFCFMVLYIYILNLQLEIHLTPSSISPYLELLRQLKLFLTDYKIYIQK